VIFYVYEHWRPDLDICFYVGKGKKNRAWMVRGRNNILHRKIVDALSAQGMCVEVRMVASGLTEPEAFRLERERVQFWRGINIDLANRTDGGEGHSGFIRPKGILLSVETKRKMSESRKGIKFTDEHRAKLSAKKLGRPRPPFTEATKAKMREASSAREDAKRTKFGTEVRRNSRIKV
jgi:hypothetical protein